LDWPPTEQPVSTEASAASFAGQNQTGWFSMQKDDWPPNESKIVPWRLELKTRIMKKCLRTQSESIGSGLHGSEIADLHPLKWTGSLCGDDKSWKRQSRLKSVNGRLPPNWRRQLGGGMFKRWRQQSIMFAFSKAFALARRWTLTAAGSGD